MKSNIIPIAGIFLACVIAAGIPAVAAADPAKAAATPIINPAPVVTPATDQPQTPAAKITTPPVNTTPVKNPDKTTEKIAEKNTIPQNITAKNGWENLKPLNSVKITGDKTSSDQTAPAPAPVVTNPPADNTNEIVKDNASPKGIIDARKISKTV